MFEQQLFGLITGNLVGVLFGLLMYRMATTVIKENTVAVHELIVELRRNRR